MSRHTGPHPRVGNRLLAVLPDEEYDRLSPYLEPVFLDRGAVLYEIGETVRDAYFPSSGMVSLLSLTEDGATIGVATVGSEGVVGIPVILKNNKTPYRVVAQFPSQAARIKADVVEREFSRGGKFQEMLLRYAHATLTQVSQLAVCNHFHSVKARLCRWLLGSRDQMKTDALPLTQELLSQLLGAPRTGVTSAVGRLQREGVIHATRGKIRILDWEGLEFNACKCYDAVREEIAHLFQD